MGWQKKMAMAMGGRYDVKTELILLYIWLKLTGKSTDLRGLIVLFPIKKNFIDD